MPVNRPWGTIEKPPFELGHQKLSADEVESVVDRLSQLKKPSSAVNKKRRKVEIERNLDKEGINAMGCVEIKMEQRTYTGKEINQMVERLFVRDYTNRNKKRQPKIERRTKVEPKEFDEDDVEKVVERLTRNASQRATDANRTGAMKQQGVVNTYAWKGWN
ncbi:predicted protein [Nematostella vectensis]|uniref:Uncharacterized protein n=1 Tax=Nematostella vectensis TaxID=45351 RepID=A7S2F6_NEMVE|nr:predicted protein [Nematostella vectensis]|eukprot:XP_001634204.1 predicted protein [Nematostella vectensis]